jgi:hypothetical protein
MSFKGVVCWRAEMVAKAMDTEALQTSRALFLATHHPIRMYRASNVQGGKPEPDDEHRFLADFMKPKGWAFAAVLGASGTGKSHLIRWLDLNVPRDKHRKVMLIPKVGTNLRNIITQILEGMEGPRFDEYRNRLAGGAQERSEAASRFRLLTNLAYAVGESQERNRQLSTLEAKLAKDLPNFLLDGVFRNYLLADGGRIDQLVTHAIGRGDVVERMEQPREFVLSDLPLDGLPDLAHAGRAAHDFYAFLSGDEHVQRATLAWMNEHLGVALRELLNMGGENLQDLMLDVREELATQGIELVLLIEDFAKLQGIDRQLLEALLTRENQPGRRPLCALRTALAVTTGYFERLDDTVKTRISFRVDMDVTSTDTNGLVTDVDVERFVSRYLNAIRQPESVLEQWAMEPDEARENRPPNACASCAHRAACHEGFGERDGIGLYPFNSYAISRAAQRVSAGGRFNPRTIINRVMKETFEKYTGAIKAGDFPPPALQQQFGASTLTAMVSTEVRQRDPQHAKRRLVLLDLWTDGRSVVNLPRGVHEAFSLPMLGQVVQQSPNRAGELVPISEPEPAAVTPQPLLPVDVPEGLLVALNDLDDWQNGSSVDLKQSTANRLRPLVYRALVEHIDWDAELMIKGSFVGTAGMMLQQRFIEFSRYGEQTRAGNFRLNIPVEAADLTDAALALQGILLYDEHGHWNFRDGTEHWRAYARQLEVWGTRVLRETRCRTNSGAEWNPVPAVVELLTIGARTHGLPERTGPGASEYVAALFSDWGSGEVDAMRTGEWRELANAFNRHRGKMVELLLSRIACTKGGSARVQIIDTAQLLGPLRTLQDSWMPTEVIPADVVADYQYLIDLQKRVGALVATAVQQEKERLSAWSSHVGSDFIESDREKVVRSLRALLSAAVDAALSPPSKSLEDALAALPAASEGKKLSECLHRLHKAKTFGETFAEVSRPSGTVMRRIEAIASAAKRYMADTEARIESKRMELDQSGGAAIDAVQTDLTTVVEELSRLLSDTETGP